ncbi:hypothetical protein JWG44_17545 [Leptospira sp. 201903071]|uniref:hypothetical protein n=1 Tax=Leptospira ainazelensis TaxID=2810034 RepID=UPI0019631F75|nr:hypothetical protein [Leptospira ainazelensis]MBM9502064.1 hypothetical protein [Leptospira ainazelensis]
MKNPNSSEKRFVSCNFLESALKLRILILAIVVLVSKQTILKNRLFSKTASGKPVPFQKRELPTNWEAK